MGVEFVQGCFTDGNIGYYEIATPNKTQSLNFIPVEVRHKQDPYIIFAEAHYNMGRDTSFFFWLSISCLVLALVLIVVLGLCFCTLVQSASKDLKQAPYVKEDLN